MKPPGERRFGTRACLVSLGRVVVRMLVATTLIATTVLAPASLTAGQPDSDRPAVRVRLIDQTTWVAPDGEIVVRVSIDNAPDAATVEVTLHERIRSRADFLETVHRQQLRGRLTDPPIELGTVAELGPTATARIPIRSGPQDPETAPRLGIADPGVHPVDIAVYGPDRQYLGGLVTHVVRLPVADDPLPLDLVLVQPLDARLSHRADGTIAIDQATRAAWTMTVDAHLDAPRLPVVLSVRPETVAALAASTAELDRRLLANLALVADDQPVAAATFVDVDIDAMLRSDLIDEVTGQLDLGADQLALHLGTVVDQGTWISRTALTDRSLDALAARGVERVVVSRDQILASDPRGPAPSEPGAAAGDDDPSSPEAEPDPDDPLLISFELGTAEGTVVDAISTDPHLQGHQGGSGDPVLDAQHLLADLAVLWFAAPSTQRITALDLGVTPEPSFIATLKDGLDRSPLIEVAPVDSVPVDPGSSNDDDLDDEDDRPLPRYRLTDTQGQSNLDGLRRDLDLVRLTIASYRGVFPATTPGDDDEGNAEPEAPDQDDNGDGGVDQADPDPEPDENGFDRLLAVVVASELSATQRSAYFATIADAIDSALAGIDVQARAITLPARDGTVPVILHNSSDRPAVVALRLDSDRLDFPTGDHIEISLAPGATTVEIAVRARASGALPLDIEVESPDGRLALASSRYTVRSTAVSGVGVAISVAAIVVLAVWWAKTARRARAARADETGDRAAS